MRDYYGQPAFRRLLVWLNANDGSGYGCIELNTFAETEDFIGQLRSHSKKKIVEVNYSKVHPDENENLIVDGHSYLTLENFRKKFGDAAVLVVTHLAETVDNSNEKEVAALVNEINMNRENYVNYPSQVLFVFPVWFMDRIYQEAHDFKSMMGFHADLTKTETEEELMGKEMINPEPNRPMPNRKMMAAYREDFENENLPINHRLEAGKKYIDVCTYFYFLDDEETGFIRKILSAFDANRERNEKIAKLAGEVRRMLEENLKAKEIFGEWLKKPETAEKKRTSKAKTAEIREERIQALKEREEKLKKEPLELAKEYVKIAGELRGQFKYKEALELDERAMRIREWALPGDDLELADSYSRIGYDLFYLEDYQKSLEYYEKALSIREKVLPEDHPDLAKSYKNAGADYTSLGNHRKALEYDEKALSIREKVLPEDHPDLAKSYNNVGVDYSILGNHRKALEYKKKALSIREKVRPEDHPDLAESYNNVGVDYENLGDYKRALEYYEKALAIYRKILPEDHVERKRTERNFARVKKKMR